MEPVVCQPGRFVNLLAAAGAGRFWRGVLLATLALVATACATDAPFTWKERRDLAWQASVVRSTFREAQAQADAAHAEGSLIVIQRGDIVARARTHPRLVAGSTPARALLSLAARERSDLVNDAICVWVTRSGVAVNPLHVPCVDEAQKADLIAEADDLSARSRAFAIEADHFKQSAALLTEGLSNTLALANLTEARLSKSEDALAITTESSTKANQTLLAVIDASRTTVVTLKAANEELARRIDDLTNRLNALK